MTIPSSHVALPATLWAPPRTATDSPSLRANVTAVMTSTAPRQRAITAGRLSMIAFQTRLASSYAASPARIRAPRRLPRSVSMEVLAIVIMVAPEDVW